MNKERPVLGATNQVKKYSLELSKRVLGSVNYRPAGRRECRGNKVHRSKGEQSLKVTKY